MHDNIKYMLNRYDIQTSEQQENALHEIVQEIILLGLSRGGFFKKAAFYGGTALRIFYGLNRFSEDLDFTAINNNNINLNSYKSEIEQTLKAYGFDFTFYKKQKKVKTPIESAFIKGNTSINLLAIEVNYNKHNDSKIKIKLEIDTIPATGFSCESKLHTGPEAFYVETLDIPSLFAGKLHAILFRQRKINIKGRDWYDLAWYLANGFKYNFNYLKNKIEQSINELQTPPKDLLVLNNKSIKSAIIARLGQLPLDFAKKDVSRFLEDPSNLDIWSKEYFNELIKRLQNE